MKDIQVQELTRRLPLVGIVAFSLCSTSSIYHLLAGKAAHPSPVLWLPAILVELVTAWAVAQVVDNARTVTRSNISKQDRRFYAGILAAFVIVALPLVALSVWANWIEFGHPALGVMFPIASIGCAVGAALPEAAERYRKRTEAERQAARAEKEARRKAREAERKQKELERQAQEMERQAAEARAEAGRKEAETKRNQIERAIRSLGREAETLSVYRDAPMATQAEVAETLGLSKRTVRNHLARLESLGLVRRNGEGVEVLQ